MVAVYGHSFFGDMSSSDESMPWDQFRLLMEAITGVKKEMEEKFTSSREELHQKVTASQESSSEEVVSKLKQRAYHFQRKGNEAQFMFNSAVHMKEHVEAAKREITKL